MTRPLDAAWATFPAAVPTEPRAGRLPSRCVEPHCEGARVAALSKSPDEPAGGLEPASPTPALVGPIPEPAAVMVMDVASWGEAPPGECPATGRRIELRVAGHLSERARGAFGPD